MVKNFVVFFLLLVLPPVLVAVPPKDRNYRGKFPKDHVHKIPDVKTLRALGYSSEQIQKVIRTTGTKKVAVILVNFPGADSTTSGSPMMTSTDITNFNLLFSSMTSFYNECSYGKLNLDVTFFYNGGSTKTLSGSESPYLLGKSMEYYGADTEGSLSQLVKDALNTAGAGVNSLSYDCVMVAHAGNGNESTNNSGDIWSVFVTWGDGAVNGFSEGTIVPAREASGSALGVICHEFGHQLGLWDLYDSNAQSSKVGFWSLMDYGVWGGDGVKPSHPCAWDKEKLGWIEPIVVNSSTTKIFLPAEVSSTTIIKIPIDVATEQYFYLEYRKKSAASPNWDGSLPGDGLLIWYVDEGIISGKTFAERKNDNTLNLGSYSHLTVDLKNADNSHPDDNNHGDSTDPWPGTRTNFTSPYSDTWDGKPTYISVVNITGAGTSQMSADIVKIAAAETLSIVRGINYPNPADIQTTIQFVLTRPPQKYRLDLYNLSGELVAENLPMNVSIRSRDNYWIYESNFNTRNTSGDLLAPGVYIYLLTADGEKKTGKLVIER